MWDQIFLSANEALTPDYMFQQEICQLKGSKHIFKGYFRGTSKLSSSGR